MPGIRFIETNPTWDAYQQGMSAALNQQRNEFDLDSKMANRASQEGVDAALRSGLQNIRARSTPPTPTLGSGPFAAQATHGSSGGAQPAMPTQTAAPVVPVQSAPLPPLNIPESQNHGTGIYENPMPNQVTPAPGVNVSPVLRQVAAGPVGQQMTAMGAPNQVQGQAQQPPQPAPSAPMMRDVTPQGQPRQRLDLSPIVHNLSQVPGGGQAALSLLQQQEKGNDDLERLAMKALADGDIETFNHYAARSGLQLPPEMLRDKQRASLFARGTLIAEKYYRNDAKQALNFTRAFVQNGGNEEGAIASAGNPSGSLVSRGGRGGGAGGGGGVLRINNTFQLAQSVANQAAREAGRAQATPQEIAAEHARIQAGRTNPTTRARAIFSLAKSLQSDARSRGREMGSEEAMAYATSQYDALTSQGGDQAEGIKSPPGSPTYPPPAAPGGFGAGASDAPPSAAPSAGLDSWESSVGLGPAAPSPPSVAPAPVPSGDGRRPNYRYVPGQGLTPTGP